jgi:hypothetical protein
MVNIRRVRTEWTGLPGGPALTTTYFPLGASTQQAIDAMDAFWTSLQSRIANDAAWTVQADVEEIDPATGNIVAVTSGTTNGGNGSDTGGMLPNGTNGLLNLRTGVYLNGREVRGKLYVPAPTTAQLSDGVPAATYSSALVTAYNALLSAASIAFIYVYSPRNATAVQVTAATPSTNFARLRSRQR